MSWIISILAFIFVLGVAVNIHELGHFLVAKILGMRVEAYSFFGLGPRIWGFRYGHTDYRISAIPLGAYVKLYGDEATAPLEGGNSEEKVEEFLHERNIGKVDPNKQPIVEQVPDSELYELRPRWQKFLVMVGGPFMNIVLALAIPFGMALVNGVEEFPPSPTVARVFPSSAAEAAGLKAGDRIISFDGMENPTWPEINDIALTAPTKAPKPMPVTVERGGQKVSLSVTPQIIKDSNGNQFGDLGMIPDYGVDVPVIITSLQVGGAGDKAGMKPGDRLVAINGEQIRNSTHATTLIRSSTGNLPVTVERQGQKVELTTTPEPLYNEKCEQIGRRLGITPSDDPPRVSAGIGRAMSQAVSENKRILVLTGRTLKQVFVGEREASSTLSGPIGIFTVTAQAASIGFSALLMMLALLSLNLGIFNLLPIPMLDGGQIFVLAIDGFLSLFNKRLGQTALLRIQQVGLVFILLLTVLVFANDIMRMVSNRGSKPAATSNAPPKCG